MTYDVILKEVEGGKHPNGTSFMVKRYYLSWSGREPEEKDPYLSVWADGSISVCWGEGKVFLYDDQWDGMIKAIKQAKDDKQRATDAQAVKWLLENSDKHEHYGCSVDLNINETTRILSTSQMRWGEAWYGKVAEIEVDGKWLQLCRTDLKDDVCTGRDANKLGQMSLEENRKYYLAKNKFGARVREKSGFAVVDSYSDG